MGNACTCFNSNQNNKPQSKLIQELLKKPSLEVKTNGELPQIYTYESPRLPSNRVQHLNKSYTDAVHYSNTHGDIDRKESHGSVHPTEYMSFDTSQMNMLRRSDVRKLSQRLSAASSFSRMKSFSEKNDNPDSNSRRRSMSQVIRQNIMQITMEFRIVYTFRSTISQKTQETRSDFQNITPDHRNQVLFSIFFDFSWDELAEIDDQLGFSHMNLRDVLTSKDPKVKYAKKTTQGAIIGLKSAEVGENGSERAEKTASQDDLETVKIERGYHRSKSYIGHDLDSVKLNLAKNGIGQKDSIEVLDRDSPGPTELMRRSSFPAKEISHKTHSKPNPDRPALSIIPVPENRAKKVIVEPLSPVIYQNISLKEENKGEKDEEGNSSVRDTAETHDEEHQFIGVSKEDMEFIKRGQEVLSLVLRILRVPDYSNFERLYKAKNEAHQLTIYYDSIQKPNGETVIKVLWTWVAPCSADKYIQFISDFEQQWKVDESKENAEEIEEIYASETESFVINYVAYKKVLISKPRDVVFLKHLRKLGPGEWAKATVSVKHEDYPEFKGRLRSEILCAGSLVSENVSGESCVVKNYSETDFKANIPSFMAKTFIKSNLKSYVERCIVALKNYN